MTGHHRWLSHTAGAAIIAAGLLVTGCGARSSGENNASATVNLNSLPAAEAWVDGKSEGSTPLAVPLSPGRHELVLKQTGFTEQRQTLEVAAGDVTTIDKVLQPVDPMDPDALRQVAAAYGITVEPFRAPEIHRGAASVSGVALLYPRNDVRKEGLSGYRIDVTPAYEGGGWLEFRKGKTSLFRQKFDPATLVSTATLPKSVTDALKTGDTVTWGIYFTDTRKAITAQFEIVAKPSAARKLAEIAADKRLALQPAALRQQLSAEVLQNHRLYSEALVQLLDMRATDKDSVAPYGGIVSCLRRLDLEDTALFTEAASKVVGTTSRHRAGDTAAAVASKVRPVGTPAAGVPTADRGTSTPATPATTPPPAPAPDDAPVVSGPSAPNALPTVPGNVPTAPGVGIRPSGPEFPTPGLPTSPTTEPTLPVPAAPTTEPTLPTPAAPTTEPMLPTPAAPTTEPTLPTSAAPTTEPVPTLPEGAIPATTPEGDAAKTAADAKKAAEKTAERAALEAKKAADRAAEEARAAADRAAKAPK